MRDISVMYGRICVKLKYMFVKCCKVFVGKMWKGF